jgi:hypothetical protein
MKKSFFGEYELVKANDFLIYKATPEKALFDYLYLKRGVVLVESYFAELRLNLDNVDFTKFAQLLKKYLSKKMVKCLVFTENQMILDEMKRALEQHKGKEDIFKIGYIKEFLQARVLRQIYEFPESKSLYFYGGTAIGFLLGLNRLSEDLDFVSTQVVDFERLGTFLTNFFTKETLEVKCKIQKFGLTLKFKNLLSHFQMQYQHANDLYLKIEISDHLSFCKHFETKIYQIFKFNTSLVLQSFDPSTLFSTKLNTVLYRHWERRIGDQVLTMKGRNIYDLFRYVSNGYKPNLNCIQDISNVEDLKKKLIVTVEATDFKVVVEEVAHFMEDKQLLSFFETNGKSYLIEQIQYLT